MSEVSTGHTHKDAVLLAIVIVSYNFSDLSAFSVRDLPIRIQLKLICWKSLYAMLSGDNKVYMMSAQ